ncbi:MAG TPA: response regulator [Chitinophagaceae bacterium]|nr:response regulator [Chitinophagaceae bacterium]
MMLKKILLAEDDSDDQKLFYDFLQDRTDVLLMPVAENGVALVETLEQLNDTNDFPDLIILDQNMPKRNGLQTLQLLKQHQRYAHIPVALYSTYTDAQLINSSTAIGACAVLNKPITKEGYHAMLDAFLQHT